jgi:hypothetical protein
MIAVTAAVAKSLCEAVITRIPAAAAMVRRKIAAMGPAFARNFWKIDAGLEIFQGLIGWLVCWLSLSGPAPTGRNIFFAILFSAGGTYWLGEGLRKLNR